jgi:hypothetical protein
VRCSGCAASSLCAYRQRFLTYTKPLRQNAAHFADSVRAPCTVAPAVESPPFLNLAMCMLCCVANYIRRCAQGGELDEDGDGDGIAALTLLGRPKKMRLFAKCLREVEALRQEQRRSLMEASATMNIHTMPSCADALSVMCMGVPGTGKICS